MPQPQADERDHLDAHRTDPMRRLPQPAPHNARRGMPDVVPARPTGAPASANAASGTGPATAAPRPKPVPVRPPRPADPRRAHLAAHPEHQVDVGPPAAAA